ncbi:protease SohB [Kangiella sp. HZ709]|uniref:protease SohB n=1 Tax=Kangiella sp. HZ709 TaxID=2666328 RepID=UPI0012AEFBDD|nr:protease SohB [Kangiella sp. HZ709]MRX28462.1 protease SohB [Kangiella sp. HZ709]
MEFIADYGLFLLKAATIVVAIIMVFGFILSAGQKQRSTHKGDIKVTNLGEEIKDHKHTIQSEVLSKAEWKALQKQEKEQDKKEAKAEKKKVKAAKENTTKENEEVIQDELEIKPRTYVLDFDGDIEASDVESLREEISAILATANKQDEVLVRLKSPGGMVHTYGLAASQLSRIKSAGYQLTIAVDEVAASGGYMMACVADKIISAPFAIIGSIGVVAEIPNFNKLLKKAHVDYEQHTAGDYKRTLTMFGENTTYARDKFKQELEDTHELFKAFITENRPDLDIEKVATGEHWYGSQALELGLIDAISTSDDLITHATKDRDVYTVKYEIKRPLSDKLSISLHGFLDRFVMGWVQRSNQSNLFK